MLDRKPAPVEQPFLALVELVVGRRQVARLHRGLVLLADQHDERARVRVDVADLVAFVRDGRIVDRDQAYVVGEFQKALAQLAPLHRRSF